jgi:hypothetical protein
VDRETTFPIGASITLDELTNTPYDVLALLRSNEAVSWPPALGAWFVTRRDLAIEAMKDADRFTADDERFTTAKVLGSVTSTDLGRAVGKKPQLDRTNPNISELTARRRRRCIPQLPDQRVSARRTWSNARR